MREEAAVQERPGARGELGDTPRVVEAAAAAVGLGEGRGEREGGEEQEREGRRHGSRGTAEVGSCLGASVVSRL